MAHVIKRVTKRTDATVPFALGAPRLRANPQFQRFFRLRKNAPGFIGQTRTLSADKLTVTTEVRWESAEAAKAFRDSHPQLARQVSRMMREYNKRKGTKSVNANAVKKAPKK